MNRPQLHAAQLRQTILDMAKAGSTVHIGCAFSIVEMLAVLYRSHLRFGPSQSPEDPERDYLVLSKGHGVMAQYACMNAMGWLDDAELDHYFGDGTRLKGLADIHVPGIEATTGSLGHGLPIGAGLALGAKRKGSDQKCFVIAGDGEMNEGSMWEAMLFATQFGLDNLTVIVDENRFQAMGATNAVMKLDQLEQRFTAFGFDAVTIDGHDEAALDSALRSLAARRNQKPKAIVAQTIKGKGVSFMENDNSWHYTRLNDETYARATKELGLR
ncbi:transketolase domain-containing protein [Pandoraea anapnoica]|uniref:Transketolase domain-containing protein n=1 Tax=Pandoraea anapnoica TaxID=2508301 RepID=A0A5E5AK11_9BURK|nr:transketolase [Pandoraea anapnoica]VVE74111.1 transketolase domain-containing protein [Pandoraea anapnoica]